MLQPAGGNSAVTTIASSDDSNEMASAFGVQREAAPAQPVAPAPQPAPQAPTNAPQQAEGSSQSQPTTAGPNLPNPATQAQPQPSPKEGKDDGKLLQKKASDSHRHLIDLLDDKFKMLSEGRIDDKELREWFDDRPDLAEVANRSKRVKDRFRSLMERDEAARYDDDIRARRASQTRNDVDEIDDDQPKKRNSFDGKALTAADLDKFLDDFETRMEQRTVQREKEEALKTFAASRNILDEDYKRLSSVTQALTQALPEWPHGQTMEAAFRALFPTKGNQQVIPQGGAVVPEEQQQALDLTNPTPLFSKEEFFGKRR